MADGDTPSSLAGWRKTPWPVGRGLAGNGIREDTRASRFPYYGWGAAGFSWAWMGFMMLFWVAVFVVLVVVGFRLLSRHDGGSALDTLKQRLAKGEISRDEYEQDRKLLAS